MSTKPEISVIIANYNHAQYIKFAVESILNQSFENFEVLVVDDGSTDNSKEVIEEICKLDKDRVRQPIYLPKNRGKWMALNVGCKIARGKLITIMDADDASTRHRLERQYKILNETKSFHVLTGFTHCYSREEMNEAILWKPKNFDKYDVILPQEVTQKVLEGYKTPGINHYYVGRDYEVHGASALYYRSLWERGMRYLPDSLGLRIQFAEDSDHNTRMTLLLQKTTVLKEPLWVYSRGTATNDAFQRPK